MVTGAPPPKPLTSVVQKVTDAAHDAAKAAEEKRRLNEKLDRETRAKNQAKTSQRK